MRILGIDAASSIASVALVENGQSIAEQRHERRRATAGVSVQLGGNHAEFVLPAIHSLLEKAHWDLSELSGIAVTVGPGSFTGLRIGLATVKGLAYACAVPVIGVSTLQANAARAEPFNGLIGSLLDARKSEVYVALFRRDGEAFHRVTDDAVMPVRSFIELLQQQSDYPRTPALLLGDGARAYQDLLMSTLGATVEFADETAYGSVAAHAARLAERRLSCGSSDDIGALTPLYLRLSEAESKLSLSALTS